MNHASSPHYDQSALWAHTPNDNGDPQFLRDHLLGVAALAERFADAFGAGELGRIVGLLHDIGKASDQFQNYLKLCHRRKNDGRRPPTSNVDHKLAGLRLGAGIHQTLGLPVLGHHGGLTDGSDARQSFAQSMTSAEVEQAIGRLDGLGLWPAEYVANLPEFINAPYSCEAYLRMLFSALVDADFLDTEAHWNPEKQQLRHPASRLSDLWTALQADQTRLQEGAAASVVNTVRREVYEACLAAAESAPGVFRLTVPTGGGKTRSAMAFALKHAVKHGLDRVIVAIPYTSIIDQNARVYRGIFGDANVVEHHSAVDTRENDEYSEESQRLLLAAENWDAPIVVTTTVQLFESLFANKPSRCRKLHNVARSVIVLDEVQTIPVGLTNPIIDMLKELVAHYGVTLVLSTATQPAFSGDSPYLKGFDPVPVEIVRDPGCYFEALKRVDYTIPSEPWSWQQVAAEMSNSEQTLCVLNSRKDALALFSLLDDPDTFHLSTLMCPAHRCDVLEEIRRRLEVGEPCRVVSTQVVEAGVDLDFPFVLRAMGPLDRIVQAAGRCNREGRLDTGSVVVFQPTEGTVPRGTYQTALAEARMMLAGGRCDLHDPEVFDQYFRRLWQDCNLDVPGIQGLRKRMNYPEVADKFRLINENTVSVVVHYGDPGPDEIIQSIRIKGFASRQDWRRLQMCAVSVYRHEFDRHRNEGLIEEVIEGIFVWIGAYSRKTGISPDVADPADLIA